MPNVHLLRNIQTKSSTYLHNGILFNSKKEWNTDRCYNMVEPQEYYVKKPDTKITYSTTPFV